MRILHLPHGYWPATGGAERLTEGWSNGLAARGHSVQVSVADLSTPEGLYRFGITPTDRPDEVRDGVLIHRISLDSTYSIGGHLFRQDPYAPNRIGDRIRHRVRSRLMASLRSEITQFKPDLVMTLPHLFENVRVVLDLHRELRFPLVWAPLLHESDPNWPFDEVRDHLKSADALIALTSSEAERLTQGYGANPDRVHVVPPGVDAPVVPPDPPDGPPTAVYLGRLSSAKGLDVLPEAMSIVWNRLPAARLVVAGATTPDVPKIRGMFENLNLPTRDSVVFTESISEEDKQKILRSATVLVLPSERESFGIVLLEAWAVATPVISVDSSIMRDVVINGSDGVLARNGTPQALAAALIDRLEDPAGSRSMGLAGHERMRSGYSWEQCAVRLESIYEQVLANRSQNSS